MLPMTASVDQWIYERYRELPDLSPSTAKRDRVDKLHIYRKAGVRRYLLVDVQARNGEVRVRYRRPEVGRERIEEALDQARVSADAGSRRHYGR